MNQSTTIIIWGNSLVGRLLHHALGLRNISSLLIGDGTAFLPHPRFLALSPTSLHWLHSLRITPTVPAQAAQMHLSTSTSGLGEGLLQLEGKLLPLFYTVSLHELHAICPNPMPDVSTSHVTSISTNNNNLTLHTQDGDINGAVLIVTSPLPPHLAKKLGLTINKSSEASTSILGSVVHAEGAASTAFQCFLPTGPKALLPLSPTEHFLIWTDTNERASAFNQHRYLWQESVREVFEPQVGPITSVEWEASVPLKLWRLNPGHEPERLIAIGSGARTIHPLAGLALNLALTEASRVVEAIAGSKEISSDVVREINDNLRPLGSMLWHTITALNNTLTSTNTLKRSIGQLGLLLGNVPFVQNKIAQEAQLMGSQSKL